MEKDLSQTHILINKENNHKSSLSILTTASTSTTDSIKNINSIISPKLTDYEEIDPKIVEQLLKAPVTKVKVPSIEKQSIFNDNFQLINFDESENEDLNNKSTFSDFEDIEGNTTFITIINNNSNNYTGIQTNIMSYYNNTNNNVINSILNFDNINNSNSFSKLNKSPIWVSKINNNQNFNLNLNSINPFSLSLFLNNENYLNDLEEEEGSNEYGYTYAKKAKNFKLR